MATEGDVADIDAPSPSFEILFGRIGSFTAIGSSATRFLPGGSNCVALVKAPGGILVFG